MGFDTTFASLATAFSAMFGGPYANAIARWPGTPTMDAGGSVTAPGTPVEVECKCQIDIATDAMRAAEGFKETDVRLLILGLDALDTGAVVEVGGLNYVLLSVTRDPAAVGWECRGRRNGA